MLATTYLELIRIIFRKLPLNSEMPKRYTLKRDKLCTVTVNGNVTITTPASNQILQHIVLTKTGDGLGFTYGNYSEAILYQPATDIFGPNPNSGETGNNTTSVHRLMHNWLTMNSKATH